MLDCLWLMENLLISNQSNQKYFVELGCVEQLKDLLIPTDFQNKEQMKVVNKVINILLEITKNCGHLNNAQIACGKIMEPLLRIISFYAFNLEPHRSRSSMNPMDEEKMGEGGGGDGLNYDLMKQKCLILLRIILYLNKENLNIFINNLRSFKLTYYNKQQNSLMDKPINPLLFLTKLSLNGYKLLPTSTELGGLDIFIIQLYHYYLNH